MGRELTRHGGRPAYRAHEADDQAWESALRPKRCLLALHRRLREVVASKLILEWSPEQISGWLKTEYPNDERMRVSHETIYRSLFIQARGVLKKELMDHLRTKRRMRRSQHCRIFKDSRGRIADALSIRERPAEAEDRAVPGHWEGDLLSGLSAAAMAVESFQSPSTNCTPLVLSPLRRFLAIAHKCARTRLPCFQQMPRGGAPPNPFPGNAHDYIQKGAPS